MNVLNRVVTTSSVVVFQAKKIRLFSVINQQVKLFACDLREIVYAHFIIRQASRTETMNR